MFRLEWQFLQQVYELVTRWIIRYCITQQLWEIKLYSVSEVYCSFLKNAAPLVSGSWHIHRRRLDPDGPRLDLAEKRVIWNSVLSSSDGHVILLAADKGNCGYCSFSKIFHWVFDSPLSNASVVLVITHTHTYDTREAKLNVNIIIEVTPWSFENTKSSYLVLFTHTQFVHISAPISKQLLSFLSFVCSYFHYTDIVFIIYNLL